MTDATGSAVINGDTIETHRLSSDSYTVGEIALAAGEYDFELLHFEGWGRAYVELTGYVEPVARRF